MSSYIHAVLAGLLVAAPGFAMTAQAQATAAAQASVAAPAMSVRSASGVHQTRIVRVQSGSCTCRFQGGDVRVGQTVCMQIGGRSVAATCTKVLNNTSWTFGAGGCGAVS
ncbi:MAG: hypothetical protein AAGF32_09755 [Pseudomonadota bacterium]